MADRQVSLPALRAALAQNTNEVFVTLLEIDHDLFINPIYLCNNTEEVTHATHAYAPFPFSVTLPSEEQEREPVVRLTVSNVDQSLIDDIRAITSGPTVTIRIVLASSPEVIEYGPVICKATNMTYTAENMSFDLGFKAFQGEPIPWLTFTPEYFPGVFIK